MKEKSTAQRQAIRLYELEKVLPWLKPGCLILEIGAGAGWQAQALTVHGFHVEAIDVADNHHKTELIWPVAEYDGKHIPFPDNYFDTVFSSNVLEHIPHVRSFQKEIQRVLKPEGIAVHVLPSSSWRFWTMIGYYRFFPHYFKQALQGLLTVSTSDPNGEGNSSAKISRSKIAVYRLFRSFIPKRHGERGNAFSELYYFSHRFWHPLFCTSGWHIKSYFPNQLFYTGYSFWDTQLSLSKRHLLSYILGSSCHIYVLEIAK